MTTTYPLLSILIRSMGRPTLSKALDSVASQTWPNLEVLVVNASGKPHPPLPEGFPSPLYLLDSSTPLQRSNAANRLLEEARGEYGLFLDDDDWLEPEHLSRLIQALQNYPEHVLAYSDVSCIETITSGSPSHELRRYAQEFDPTRLLLENYIPIHAALFSLDLVRQHPQLRFDSTLNLFEDWDFWLQLLQHGTFLHVPGVSAWYRIHGDSGTGVRLNEPQLATEALSQLLEKWRKLWSNQQLSEVIGLARHVYQLQAHLQASQLKANQLTHDMQVLKQKMVEQEQEHTQALQAENELHQTQLSAQANNYQVMLNQHNQAHQTALNEQRLYYENSRSWRITQPLRLLRSLVNQQGLVAGYKKYKATIYAQLLTLLTRCYNSAAYKPFDRCFSPILKRRIRNHLFLKSMSNRHHARAVTGLLQPVGKQTLISIIIPVYNHARYLRQCLDSALQQSWENLEVIVVNDASPDPLVAEILDSYQDHPRLRLIHLPENGGICHAQNQALIASQGQIIAFLDCDDYLHPDAIKISMQHWQADTVYAHTGRVNIDEHGDEINRIHFVELPRTDYFQENLRAMYATHLKMIRRDAFVKVGLFDLRFDTAQDYEMLMRIAFHYPSSSFLHVPGFVYYHRLHQQQATEQHNDKQQKLTLQIQREARLRQSIREGEYKRFISIIMLSYGKHSQTLDAIKGLQQTINIPHEIILYDNGSTSETVEFIRQHIDGHFDNVRVFYGQHNLGPAQGRRKALKHATGEWFIIFDNDEIPGQGWLEELLLRAEVNDNVGAVNCRVVFPDGKLQFSGGYAETSPNQRVDLKLYDMGKQYTSLESCVFRELDWCPIGATLFTENIAPYLHSGYPNVFEDAGVSYALKKKGLRLLNAPGALVWHEHVTYRKTIEMGQEYMQARYNPQQMLISIASFYRENRLIIHDEYVWRENQLYSLCEPQLLELLEKTQPEAELV